MRVSTLFVLTGITSVSAFVPQLAPITSFKTSSSLLFAATTDKSVPIVVTGNNVEVTPALMDYVNKKNWKGLLENLPVVVLLWNVMFIFQ